MKPGTQRLYLDSCVITRWLTSRDQDARDVDQLIDLGRSGQAMLIVSTLTYIEVTRERHKPVDPRKMALVMQFFQNDYVYMADFHAIVAESAVKLIYDYLWLQPNDAGHLATAIELDCKAFFTYDDDLLRKFDGERGLQVRKPGDLIPESPIDSTGLPLLTPLEDQEPV
jgi:predicted nucleic acid-binding protein